MPADASIYSQFLRPVRSVQDFETDLDNRDFSRLRLEGQRSQNALMDLMRQQQSTAARQGIAKQNAIEQIYGDPRYQGKPESIEDALIANPLTSDEGWRRRDQRLGSAKTGAEVRKLDAEGQAKQGDVEHANSMRAVSWLAGAATPEELRARVLGLPAGVLPAHQREGILREIPTDRALYPNWQRQLIVSWASPKEQADARAPQMVNAGGQLVNTNPMAGNVAPIAVTQSPDNKATVEATLAGQRSTAATAANRLAFDKEQAGKGVLHDTDAGTALIDPRTGGARLVTNPATGLPLTKPLKDIPASVNTAIIANTQSLNQLDRALTLVGGKNVGDPAKGGQQGDAAATGWKGYLPNNVLNRVDSQGVDARAEIGDIGSLKIHDRSGAAVTLSESPRLMPFIPLVTDDQATVQKKLRRLRTEVENEANALAATYSKEQGYKPSPVKAAGEPAAGPSAPAAVQPFSDAAKEQRYQAWKRQQQGAR